MVSVGEYKYENVENDLAFQTMLGSVVDEKS